jgi:transcription elongation factor S-II
MHSETGKCLQVDKLGIFTVGGIYAGTHDPEDLADRIEKRLYEFHKGTGDKYKSALRSRVFNLRDKKNHALRENVLTGAVTAEKFATMTAEEMASEEMKKTREAFTKESILEHQMSVQEGWFC